MGGIVSRKKVNKERVQRSMKTTRVVFTRDENGGNEASGFHVQRGTTRTRRVVFTWDENGGDEASGFHTQRGTTRTRRWTENTG